MKRLLTMGFCVWMLMSISMLGISSALAADAVASAKYEGAGSQLYQSGDFAKAIQYYQAAIQTDPSRTASYVGLGNSQYRLGHKEEALAAYEKALALDPTNAQLGQFVKNLKGTPLAASSPAPPVAGSGTVDPLKQGTDLFSQKRYAESIPMFEQAAASNPGNPQIQYYWAYACAMVKDNKGAALHFYKFNTLSPNPGVQTYAERLKAGLPPEEQRWVENQLAGNTNAAYQKPKRFKKFGLSLLFPSLVATSQSSMKSYADTVVAATRAEQSYNPSASCEVSVPTGFLDTQLQARLNLSPKFELAFSLDYASAGHLKTTYADNYYSYNDDISFTSVGVGAYARYSFAKPGKKLRPYLGAGLLLAAASASETYVNSEGGSGSASANASGIGGEFQAGLDFCFGSSVRVGPVLGYRSLKATGFKIGSQSVDLDLGGPTFGLMFSAFF